MSERRQGKQRETEEDAPPQPVKQVQFAQKRSWETGDELGFTALNRHGDLVNNKVTTYFVRGDSDSDSSGIPTSVHSGGSTDTAATHLNRDDSGSSGVPLGVHNGGSTGLQQSDQ